MELREAIELIKEFLADKRYGYVRVNCQAGWISNANWYETRQGEKTDNKPNNTGTALDHRKPSEEMPIADCQIPNDGNRKSQIANRKSLKGGQ